MPSSKAQRTQTTASRAHKLAALMLWRAQSAARLTPKCAGACYLYGRSFNPTVRYLGQQLAALEGLEAGYTCSSGAAPAPVSEPCEAAHLPAAAAAHGRADGNSRRRVTISVLAPMQAWPPSAPRCCSCAAPATTSCAPTRCMVSGSALPSRKPGLATRRERQQRMHCLQGAPLRCSSRSSRPSAASPPPLSTSPTRMPWLLPSRHGPRCATARGAACDRAARRGHKTMSRARAAAGSMRGGHRRCTRRPSPTPRSSWPTCRASQMSRTRTCAPGPPPGALILPAYREAQAQ